MNSAETVTQETTGTLAFPIQLHTKALDAGSIVIEADFNEGTLALIAGVGDIKVNITNAESYSAAAVELAKIKAVSKKIDADRRELTRPLDDEKNRVMDYVRPFTTALERAETEFKNALIAYEKDQERKRQLVEAEEAERLRKQQAALDKRAERAEASGRDEKAETLREQASELTYAAPAPVAVPPKVSGISSRTTYNAEVTNLMDLVKAVAEGRAPLKYVMADMNVLNTIAKALKEDYSVPGTKVVARTSMSARAAR